MASCDLLLDKRIDVHRKRFILEIDASVAMRISSNKVVEKGYLNRADPLQKWAR